MNPFFADGTLKTVIAALHRIRRPECSERIT